MPMIDVEVAITIRRPRRDVAAIMFDPQRDAEWIGGVVQVVPSDSGPVRRGTTLERVSRRLGRRFACVLQVVDHVPDRALELRAQQSTGQHIRYTLEGIPEGTIARIQSHLRPAGRWRLTTAVHTALLRRAIIRDLDRLKWLVEAGDVPGRGL